MSAVLTIDLTKNPEVAALVADMQPGDKVYGCFTIKDRDDQSLNIRIKEMAASCDELKESASEDMGEDETDEEGMDNSDDQSPEGKEAETPSESPAKKLARQVESNGPTGY